MFHPTRLHSSFLFSKSTHSCRKKKFISGAIFLSQAVGFSYCRVCLFFPLVWPIVAFRVTLRGIRGEDLRGRWKKSCYPLLLELLPFPQNAVFCLNFFLFNYQHILTCEESDGPPSAAAGPKTNVKATRVAACSLTFSFRTGCGGKWPRLRGRLQGPRGPVVQLDTTTHPPLQLTTLSPH